MDEIDEYGRRIGFALERIERGVVALKAHAPAVLPGREAGPDNPVWAEFAAQDKAEIARLREALDAERAEKAQLAERVRALREKQETTLSAMEKRLVQATQVMEVAQAENTRLKRANADLAEANRVLVEAGTDPAPHLVNSALQAELDALRAERALEVAELDAILAGLEPLIETHGKRG
ncbi:hypothetical protein [Paenirhodobacter sp.]|uniref:hypothetical protein n=1 Tax=Paenirhodobacter sp. TaxID=1965326 RepID=UPI003B3C7591